MRDKGIAHIGIGEAQGDNKAMEAVQMAVASPLLETTIKGATHVIINISGDISLMDANDAASYVQEMAGDSANIIFGAMYDDTYADEASITVIATGLEDHNKEKKAGTRRTPPDFRYKNTDSTSAGGFTFQRTTSAPATAPAAGTTPSRAPESRVVEKDIQIPEFLRRN